MALAESSALDWSLILPQKWFAAFILTLIIELPVYAFLCRKQTTVFRVLAAGSLGTLITHPLLWFVWQPLTRTVWSDSWVLTPLGEGLVVVVEALVLMGMIRGLSIRKAISV